MDLKDVQKTIHSKQLTWLRLDRLVRQPLFTILFESSNAKERDAICRLLNELRIDELESLMKEIIRRDLDQFSRRELIKLARKLHIHCYGVLPKDTLLIRIRDAQSAATEEENI